LTDPDPGRAERERYSRFFATDLGKLYQAYSAAMIDYWRRNSDDSVPTAKLKTLSEALSEKQAAFTAKLMELAGI
jgi:hypothetical protein